MSHIFKPWNYYRHRNCIDVDIAVVTLKEVDKGLDMVVTFWNRKWKCFQGEQDNIFIKREDFDNWKEVNADD